MSKYMKNVPYLEQQDVNSDGSLKPHVGNGKACVVMVQGLFCGYCTQAKPAFENCSKQSKNVRFVTVQIDGGPSEKSAGNLITKNDSSYRGVPTYFGFNSQGKYVGTHTGGRDEQSLMNFASGLN